MIRLSSVLIFFLIFFQSAISQDVFNLENSKRFANYLFESGQFGLAADEYERVVFMAPTDTSSIQSLLSSYRLDKNYRLGVKRAFEIYPQTTQLEGKQIRELILLNAFAKNFQNAKELVNTNTRLNEGKRNNYTLSLMMLDHDWGGANKYFSAKSSSDPYFNELGTILLERQNLKKKNPFLAASMSFVIPGSGKLYTKNWQDGLIAFLFVASNAWQSYRGFSKDGIKSTYGWVFGSIGAGFWLGNIYGSYKSAQKFNQHIQKDYYDKVSDIIYDSM